MNPIDGLDLAGLLVGTATFCLPAASFVWWGFRLPAERVTLWAHARDVAIGTFQSMSGYDWRWRVVRRPAPQLR